jgi:hypothetical protein
MLSSSELQKMSQMEITEVDKNNLKDIRTVVMDAKLSQVERVEQYLSHIHNPYCFRSGDTPVRIRFVGEKPLSQSLVEYFSRLKQK